jgi:hypothetical protein
MAASYPPASWLRPALPQALEGTDRFADADATVLDFWRWAFSDLRGNAHDEMRRANAAADRVRRHSFGFHVGSWLTSARV